MQFRMYMCHKATDKGIKVCTLVKSQQKIILMHSDSYLMLPSTNKSILMFLLSNKKAVVNNIFILTQLFTVLI